MLLLNGQVVEAALGLIDTPNLPVELVVTFAPTTNYRTGEERGILTRLDLAKNGPGNLANLWKNRL